jgi:hypothetical protein
VRVGWIVATLGGEGLKGGDGGRFAGGELVSSGLVLGGLG